MTMRDMSQTTSLRVIGGSGLYDIEGLTDVDEVRVETPFGPPSDAIVRGRLERHDAALPARATGAGTASRPHAIDFRANICALKKLGATHLVSISAVGLDEGGDRARATSSSSTSSST